MASSARTAVVVGGGISGAASAWDLHAAGWQVSIVERDDPRDIVSSVAAALWHPFAVGGGRTDEWALACRDRLLEFARDPASGVRVVRGLELKRSIGEPPRWARLHPSFRDARPDELPPDRPAGFVFDAPVAEMGVFLPWLRARLAERGVRFERRELRSLEPLVEATPLVVNCAGLGARELVRDAALVPWRGTVLRVERGATEEFLLDDDLLEEATYVIPRGNDLVLGGSVEPGMESRDADEAVAEAVRGRCEARLAALRGAKTVSTATHLRPWRPSVRLELERPRPDRALVHNYGHGGAGVTLAFGCSAEVARLAECLRGRETGGTADRR